MACEIEEEEIELWPENELPLSVFSRLGDCWRYAPMGGRIGLDWLQVEAVMRQMRVSRKDAFTVLEAIRRLAVEALKEG